MIGLLEILAGLESWLRFNAETPRRFSRTTLALRRAFAAEFATGAYRRSIRQFRNAAASPTAIKSDNNFLVGSARRPQDHSSAGLLKLAFLLQRIAEIVQA